MHSILFIVLVNIVFRQFVHYHSENNCSGSQTVRVFIGWLTHWYINLPHSSGRLHITKHLDLFLSSHSRFPEVTQHKTETNVHYRWENLTDETNHLKSQHRLIDTLPFFLRSSNTTWIASIDSFPVVQLRTDTTRVQRYNQYLLASWNFKNCFPILCSLPGRTS